MVPDASRILLRNVYGWFERIARGTYRLTLQGEAAVGGQDLSSLSVAPLPEAFT
jgi:hypothetical protein